jgi:hypothetical protein
MSGYLPGLALAAGIMHYPGSGDMALPLERYGFILCSKSFIREAE